MIQKFIGFKIKIGPALKNEDLINGFPGQSTFFLTIQNTTPGIIETIVKRYITVG